MATSDNRNDRNRGNNQNQSPVRRPGKTLDEGQDIGVGKSNWDRQIIRNTVPAPSPKPIKKE